MVLNLKKNKLEEFKYKKNLARVYQIIHAIRVICSRGVFITRLGCLGLTNLISFHYFSPYYLFPSHIFPSSLPYLSHISPSPPVLRYFSRQPTFPHNQ